jgi:carbon starvation protein
MFGIANQLLAVLALALVTTWLVNQGRGRYAWVTILPMLFVCTTTLTAGTKVVQAQTGLGTTVGYVNAGLTIFVIACVCTVLLWAIARWLSVWLGTGAAKPPGAT